MLTLVRHVAVAPKVHRVRTASRKQPLVMSSSAMQEMITGPNAMMGSGGERDDAEGPTPSLVFSDPPVHDHLRNIVNRGFTPRQIAELEARVAGGR